MRQGILLNLSAGGRLRVVRVSPGARDRSSRWWGTTDWAHFTSLIDPADARVLERLIRSRHRGAYAYRVILGCRDRCGEPRGGAWTLVAGEMEPVAGEMSYLWVRVMIRECAGAPGPSCEGPRLEIASGVSADPVILM